MVMGISKRQQFRNERALQDLIRSVPGNDRCADCQAMNPGWASWNMGLFLCMRCAAIHRKLGTHISKVKSLSMDTWTADQVDNMKSHGNNLMNKIYNPKNVKPPIPTDVDEADACMERFIRQKYQYRSLEEGKAQQPPSRHDSGYDRSPEGSPPPLPPKPNRPIGFGLRSASSATNLRRVSDRQASPPPPLPTSAGSDPVFESNLATLRSMGFANERRNAGALRGLDGNLDKAIETLMRLGEGGSHPTLRSKTPTTATGRDTASRAGSANPFDQLDANPPAQSNGQSYNPFDMPSQPQQPPMPSSAQPLDVSFQHLQVSQPLFPHSTGGYPQSQPALPQPLYQQSATPPSAAQPQGILTPPISNQSAGSPQTNNPFFTQPPPQPTSAPQVAPAGYHPPRHANTMPALSTSAFGQPSPFQSQAPQPQPQAQPQTLLQPQQSQYGSGSLNPYQTTAAPTAPQSLAPPSQFGVQQLTPQPTGRMNKNNILSLYQFAPPPPTLPEQPPLSAPLGGPQAPTSAPNFAQPNPNPGAQPPFDASGGSRNPFFTQAPGAMPTQAPMPAQAPMQPAQAQSAYGAQPAYGYGTAMNSAPSTTGAFPRGHMSQQSVDINGFQTGRHSPDAFASLSARYG
ncbi:ArfGap-domain-containing protein [Aspergillus campestris IBT 28561]|uniref:ArfGap-domain-containing protein n=1 Tax=Aspergillus campestris (strain IBT 28561) TaxID=1392248 RepID=A0A2I1CRL8_ASPC2|nr:ArfGap-domain-containing protein [Aspergillus campestris IBT 28561]PKY00276.1 ArfGap-domain-containing protein [Aspergillus campestris IBT 28561]